MTYNTGNALGSTDVRDLLDNAVNLDDAVNDIVNDTWVDRFGRTRKTLKGYDAAFEEDQAARAAAFQAFLEGTGWSSLGAYGAGVVITSHTQYVTYLGQPYSLKPSIPASLDAPYVTTGVWATEGVNFKLVGDNSLRQDLVTPAVGATIVAIPAPNGTASTVSAELKEIDLEYARSAWATLAGNLQTGPMSVQAGRYIRNSGLASDDTYNDLAYKDIIAGLRPGSEVAHPKRGQVYLKGGYEITTSGIHLRGSNSRNSYDQFLMRFTNPAVPAFKVKHSGFAMTGLLLHAATVGRGVNATQDAIEWDLTLNSGHADSVIDKCGFLYFRAGGSIKSSPGRNARFTECDFSNGRHIFSMEYPVAGPEDQRVFEFTAGCKAHSMGRLEAGNVPNPDDALFYFNPLSQALSLIVSDMHADDSTRVFRGFVGQSSIKNVEMTRARGCIADIDATGFSQPGYEIFSMANVNLMNIGTTNHQLSGIKTRGPCLVTLDGIGLYATGGHGLDIGSNNATVDNVTAHNAGMGLTDTYSGIHIEAGVTGTLLGSGNTYSHGLLPLASRSAKFAVENLGTDTTFQDAVLIRGLPVGKEYFLDATQVSHGPDPIRNVNMPRISYGSAVPTTGRHTLGDLHINISSSGTNYGWRCIAGSTFVSGAWTAGSWISVGREPV